MRNIDEIAVEILVDLAKKTKNWEWKYRYMIEYIKPMFALKTTNDSYGLDSADSIIRYFLANAQSWRGDTARRIKRELKDMVGIK